MNFQELGQALQEGREAKGMTIEAVMEATKISRINLIALESGDSSSMPHPVYTKGFVKSYARLLGLDADELSMVVDREYQLDEQNADEVDYEVSPSAEKAFQEADAPAVKKRSVWPSILLVVVLSCSIIALVMYLNKSEEISTPVQTSETSESVETPESSVVMEPIEDAVETVEPAEGEAVVEEAVTPVEVPEEIKPEPAPATPQPEAEKPVAAQPAIPQPGAGEKEVVATQEAAPGQTRYAHVMIITATTNKGCWIGVWKGDESKMARDFVLKKGEPLRLMFNYPRRIRIGNVAGVTVTYNGKPYALDKNKSNIQTLFVGME
ncbi:putative membrane protein YmfM [Pseudodesulfovibrio nedwellii]|uniref:Membrane protein YmfM n=1 Tax=Pseudodesulfovibrio nedwellii TaxID=2973072 RepID=A0ABN6S1W8_9BACT|nr:helix-turn-helix domain-containing protein [Pseudodesulfovibrio nedwellii]BDQ36088.1 putative membrane protein YmfM [Pseudodesulfovibrio nedwellii]